MRRAMRRTTAQPSELARICEAFFEKVWDGATAASNAVSEALIEASEGPLYTKERRVGPTLQSVPIRALHRFLARYESQTGEEPCPTVQIVREADRYLRRVPGGGAVLNHLVTYISQGTGYRKREIRSVVLQNFRSNGELVWKQEEPGISG
jgi:hypothetical protein